MALIVRVVRDQKNNGGARWFLVKGTTDLVCVHCGVMNEVEWDDEMWSCLGCGATCPALVAEHGHLV